MNDIRLDPIYPALEIIKAAYGDDTELHHTTAHKYIAGVSEYVLESGNRYAVSFIDGVHVKHLTRSDMYLWW